jgi:MFS family permease
VKALLVGTFVNRLGGFLQIFLVLYLTHRGFSAAKAGLALGAYGAGSVVGILAAGWTSDRAGPRLTIVASMVCASALLPTMLFLRDYLALLAVVAVLGAVSQAYRPASTSLLSELTPVSRQVMVFAMCRLAINLGTTAAPLIGAALLQVSYSLLFVGESVATLVFAVVAGVALPPDRTSRDAERRREPASDDGAPVPRQGYGALLRDRRYLLFLLAMFVNAVVYLQCISALPLAVRGRGMSPTVYAGLLGINGLVVICCELLVTRQVQKHSARFAIVTGIALTAIGMTLYGPAWGLAGLAAATVVWTVGEVVGYPTLFYAYPAQAGPRHLRGRYLGASNGLWGLASAVGPVAGVTAWTNLGDRMWYGCGALGAVAIAAALFGVPRTGRVETSTAVAAAGVDRPDDLGL